MNATLTLRTVRALATKHGGVLVDESGDRDWTYQLEAPAGYVWASCGNHVLCTSTYRGPWGRQEMFEDMMARMKDGVRKCDEPNCEVCEDNRAMANAEPKREP